MPGELSNGRNASSGKDHDLIYFCKGNLYPTFHPYDHKADTDVYSRELCTLILMGHPVFDALTFGFNLKFFGWIRTREGDINLNWIILTQITLILPNFELPLLHPS